HPLGDDATAEQLLAAPAAADAYLNLAATGQLRLRRTARTASGDHSRQIRIEVLALLARACGLPPALPPQPDPPSREPVPARPRGLLRASLTDLADRRDATPGQLRMLAIGCLVSDTGARAGELCSLTLEDLSPTLEEVRLLRRPQGWAEEEAYLEVVELTGLTRAALRRWLPERQALLQRVSGSASAVWVSLHGNHRHGQTTPPGTPLQPRGLARAWTKSVVTTNHQFGGEPGWEPLPTRMEQLRRGVEPVAEYAPHRPDAERAPLLTDDLTAAGAALAAARRDGEEDSTAELEARVAARQALRAAWAEGLEHTGLVDVLTQAGLQTDAELASAGWEPVLLHALHRRSGVGRPSRAQPDGGSR
ncbi:hypothetical protein ABZ686_02260, partial [Streptomyces sp. NPDC006992]|uniref:hypothetical protein n=1 Tax=Streptomyces sp. NPDC006992 TaxID=3155601 RepID=UPI0033F94DAD